MTAHALLAPDILEKTPERIPSLRLLRALALKRRLENRDLDRNIPLCVGVEGALVRGRITQEVALALICAKPWKALPLLFDAWRRPPRFEARVGELTRLDPSILPFRHETLRFLRDQRARGRTLVLVGTARQETVRAIADYLGIFAYSLGGGDAQELTAASRARLLCAAFGAGGFDYVGEGARDIPTWATARRAIIASPAPRVLVHPTWNSQTADILAEGWHRSFAWLDAMRPSRWPRALLIFTPLLGLEMPGPYSLVALYCAFCALVLVAAAGDLISDMAHLSEDRRDPLNRRRPLASGYLGFDRALVLAAFVGTLGFLLAVIVSPFFAAWLALYPLLALGYAFRLKRVVGLDVLALAALDLHRIAGGAVVLGILPFFWQIAFATPFFIGIAAWRRHGALMHGPKLSPVKGLKCARLRSLGIASGYVSALVLALYGHDGDSARSLGPPLLSWILCPLLLVGVTIAWVAGEALRSRMRDLMMRGLRGFVLIAGLSAVAFTLLKG